TGTVSTDGQTVRFTRPGLVEEYTVSLDGVRQDFVVLEPPEENSHTSHSSHPSHSPLGQLQVHLAVTGARVEPAAGGAILVLNRSGRKIAYTHLRVTDATGRELPARLEVVGHGESQRDSIAQPGVASLRATLGQRAKEQATLKGLHHEPMLASSDPSDTSD